MQDMERRTKLKLAVAAAAAFVLAVAVGAAGALAITSAFSDDEEPTAAIEETVTESDDEPSERDDERSAPEEALGKALDYLLDEAVEAGRLTEEEAQELRERLESERPFLLPRLDDRLFDVPDFAPFGPGRLFFGPALDLEVAAEYLDLTPAELRRELADGRSLADVARDQGKSVDGLVRELVDAARERIDDAVADGRLSEERAARLKDGLEERIRDRVNDEFRLGPLHFPFKDLWRDLEPRGRPG